ARRRRTSSDRELRSSETRNRVAVALHRRPLNDATRRECFRKSIENRCRPSRSGLQQPDLYEARVQKFARRAVMESFQIGLAKMREGHERHLAFDVPEERHRIALLRSEEHTSELQSRENLVCRL